MMASDSLDYAAFVDTGMRGVVREILRQVERTGLPGQHHFFISYRTDFPGVMMSDGLRSKYPEEITIVLQHQYWDMRVEEDLFRVSLSFSNIPEKLVVPFQALTGFADPSTKFGLQFHHHYPDTQDETSPAGGSLNALAAIAETEIELPQESAKIITLDAFRKK
jgi:hypothetical protein